MSEIPSLGPEFERLQRGALVAGVVGLGLCAAGAFANPKQFFFSWMLGFLFWMGIALGSLALLMLHHLVGGSWGFIVQRALEAAARSVPLMLLMVLPLLLGIRHLYLWADPQVMAHDAVLRHKAAYLNVPFFLARTGVYFAVWLALAYFATKWSTDQDRSGDPALSRRLEALAGPGLILYGLTVTFASVDWVMSLEPHWFSTIYGAMFMIGQALAAMALAVRVAARASRQPPLLDVILHSHFHDLGNLLLAFTMLWAYMSFSQFLIIWSANLPEEIPWYLHRMQSGWQWVALLLVGFHFFLPFLLLLSRFVKRKARVLARLALAILVMRLVDLFWLVAPAHHQQGLRVHWMDVAAPVGIGGIWLAAFIWQLGRYPLLPLHDPRLAGAFGTEHHAHELQAERLQHE